MKLKSLINDISNHFRHWEYGFIEGFIIGLILLSFSYNSLFTTILLMPLILAIILIGGKIVYPYLKEGLIDSMEYEEDKSRGCPECGNLTRHKKGCSFAKKK